MADNSKSKIGSMVKFFITWVAILVLAFVFNLIAQMSNVPMQINHHYTVAYPTRFNWFTVFWLVVLAIVIIRKFIEYKHEVRA